MRDVLGRLPTERTSLSAVGTRVSIPTFWAFECADFSSSLIPPAPTSTARGNLHDPRSGKRRFAAVSFCARAFGIANNGGIATGLTTISVSHEFGGITGRGDTANACVTDTAHRAVIHRANLRARRLGFADSRQARERSIRQ